ncbi:MAG: class II aldolase/adducin family protein [Nitrososphaerota archaeon]
MNFNKMEKYTLEYFSEKIVYVSKKLFETGLVKSTFGVVSVRLPETNYVIITPSGFSKEKVSTENLIVVDFEGNVILGKFRPSVETSMHLYIHQKIPEANCVIHTHSPLATAFAIAERDIPCVSAEQAFMLGGQVPIVKKYSFPGTTKLEELEEIVKALMRCKAVLLRKHGVVVIGSTPEEALDNAIIVEDVAAMTIYSLILGKPLEFTTEEIYFIQNFKKTRYGQKPGVT